MNYLFLLLIAFSSIAHAYEVAHVTASERALIAVVNLATGREHKNQIKTKKFEYEEANALRIIEEHATPHYRKVVLLFREETNEINFLENLKNLVADPQIKVIDMIIDLHGHNASFAEGAPALGFYHPQNKFTLTSELSFRIKQLSHNKVRMIYSDACWGVTHNKDWLNAGFVAAAGSQMVDGNHFIDLELFLRKWVAGEKFGKAIRFANGNIAAKAIDWIISADSTKVPVGDLNLTIDSMNPF